MTREVYTWDSGRTVVEPVIRKCRCCNEEYYFNKNSHGFCRKCDEARKLYCDHSDRLYSKINSQFEGCTRCGKIRTIRRKEDEY